MNGARKRILFVTGTRADFGKMKSLIREVENSEEYEAYIFATGMHTLARYGSTVKEIEKAGFRNIFSFINQDGAVSSQMDLVAANTIQGIGHYLREFPPDLMVVHGDRVEALAAAVAGSLNNVLVGHIEGGEVSGTIDELIRHAVTKLSHLHFVANDEARGRLIQMGELPESVYVIGSPDIDLMLSDTLPPLEEVKRKYEIDFDEYLILIYHPVHSEINVLRRNIDVVVDAIERSGKECVIIHPNNDAGVEIIMERLETLRDREHFRMIPSMRFEYFLTLLKHARAIVGNSSTGVREAPVYGVPTINIGTRQSNRFHYPSIINVSEDQESILGALAGLPRAHPPSRHFGEGNSAQLFMERLRTREIWENPRQKQFRDMER